MQSYHQAGDNNDGGIDVSHPIYQSLDEDRRLTATCTKLLRLADSFLPGTMALHTGVTRPSDEEESIAIIAKDSVIHETFAGTFVLKKV